MHCVPLLLCRRKATQIKKKKKREGKQQLEKWNEAVIKEFTEKERMEKLILQEM